MVYHRKRQRGASVVRIAKDESKEKEGGIMASFDLTRRDFVKVAAATAAAVSASGYVSSFIAVDPACAAEDPEVEIVPTSCRACISNCGVLAHVRNGRVIKIEGDPIDPMSKGRVCAKGFAAVQALYHPNRMKYPLKRVGERGGNEWERISWQDAIALVADNLMEIYAKDPMKLVVSTGGGGNPQFFGLVRFLQAFGGGNFFEPGCAQCYLPRMCTQPILNGCQDTSIADSTVSEIYYTKTIPTVAVLWATDPSQSHVTSGGRAMVELRELGTKTIVVDPRFTPDASKADIWLPIRPGTDVAMQLAWMRYILAGKHYDEQLLTEWSNLPFLINEKTLLLYHADELGLGSKDDYVVWDTKTNALKPMPYPFDSSLEPELDGEFDVGGGTMSRTAYRALWESCEEWTVEKAAEITWCNADAIEAAIQMYIEGAPHGGISIGVATDQYEQSAQAAEGVTILDILVGNIQKQGNFVQMRPNKSLGTYFLFPFNLFGPNALAPSEETVNRRLGLVEHKGLGYWLASHIPTIMSAMSTGMPYQPEMWIDRSGNKLAMIGDASTFKEAMSHAKFIVHMYMYPTSTSTELADLLLPTAEWLETAYGADRCNVWLIRRDVVHTFEHVDETLIWSWFAAALADRGHERAATAFDPEVAGPAGPYWRTYDEYKAYLAAFIGQSFNRELSWDEAIDLLPAEYIDMDTWITSVYGHYLQTNPETGGPNGFNTNSKRLEPYGEAMTIMGRTGGPNGASFWDGFVLPAASVDYLPLPSYIEPAESPQSDTEYPYSITQGRVPHYHHGTLRNIPYLREIYPVPQTWINPETAAEIGVEEGDWCYVESRRGKITGQVKVTSGIAPKVIYQERFWNPELMDSDDPSQAWKAMNINVLTKNDAPYNPEFGTYTLRGFQVKITKAESAPEGVWYEPRDFEPWMPQPSDDTGGGYAVYDA
jgi:anaerobic selenocysteine-containing dehydrogenase